MGRTEKIAVLAVQGAFIEQEQRMWELGAECVELRQKSDLRQDFAGLILPGGESTVQGKLLVELGLLEPLRDRIRSGLPVLGTCAGLILLSEEIVNEDYVWLGTLPVKIRRNAYGRQLGSFCVKEELKGIGTVPMTFIRAPYVESVEDTVEILARVEDRIVAVRYENQLGLAFHPELDMDNRIHQMFLDMCRQSVCI